MTDSTPTGYRALSADEIAPLLALRPNLAQLLGGDARSWQVRDVADGNINAV